MKNTDDVLKKCLPEISQAWQQDIIPKLQEYITIPNKSPAFDAEWKKNGHMDKAMQLIVDWCSQQKIKNMKISVHEEAGRTPLLFIEIPGSSEETILLYGHMDKQPEMRGWDADLGPWKPVIRAGRLYGRGGADDGYSVFAALTAIATLERHQIPHARCVVMIEACEESGSGDLSFYLEKLAAKINKPNFVICMDSGCGNYEQLWSTTSLRGLINGILRIEVLKKGMHSGAGSGVVPNPFHILQILLARIENLQTGKMQLDELQVIIPEQYKEQAITTAKILGKQLLLDYPFKDNAHPVSPDLSELILNRTWRPALSVIGIEGLPNLTQGGNVTIPNLSVKLSMRIPPGVDPGRAGQALTEALEKDPPYFANVSYECTDKAAGWQAPLLAQWLKNANDKASKLFFNKPAAYFGEGGTIPFMAMLGKMFPDAQFLITGVLGPDSSAHGPNEFLHLDMAERLTACITSVIADHYNKK